MGGGLHWNIFEFLSFWKSFHTEAAQNDAQWRILPKKGLRLAQNGQFWSFCMFSHLFPQNEAQIDSEWPISLDSQLFLSFATKVSHFWRNLKNFCSGGGSSLANFLFELFPTKVVQNDPQWPILSLKWLELAWNRQFWLNFNKNLNISEKSWPICTKPSEQGLFFPAGQNESKEYYAMIKTDENLNITSDDEPSHLSNESCQKCNKMIWQPLFSHFWQFL